MLNSPLNPGGRHPRCRRHRRARPAGRRHADHDHERRGLRAHHLRRRAPREHGAPRRAPRPQLHRRILRQDLSRDRLEGRLRRRAGGADGRVPQGAPVRHLLDQHADPVRAGGVPLGEARLPRAVGVLPAQAGSVPGADRRLEVEAAEVTRHLLPAARLLGDHRREGHGLRAAPDEGSTASRRSRRRRSSTTSPRRRCCGSVSRRRTRRFRLPPIACAASSSRALSAPYT